MAKMHKHRLRFSKSGRACYLSHLDLMRTFPRAFLRAGLSVKQTEGFNQHSFVSIALPLSLGYSSQCELLEFELLSDVPLEEVPARMNAVLPEGITVQTCYESVQPVKEIGWVDWECRMTFDGGVPEGAGERLVRCFDRESMVIQKPSKKSRKGFVELNLIPLIHTLDARTEGNVLTVQALLAAGNPGLNPEVLLKAAKDADPTLRPDFTQIHRREVYNGNFEIFR